MVSLDLRALSRLSADPARLSAALGVAWTHDDLRAEDLERLLGLAGIASQVEPAWLGRVATLLGSAAWYDANGGDVYGGRCAVEIGEVAAGILAERGAVGLLEEGLRNGPALTRERAARELGRMGAAAKAAAETLLAALSDEEEAVAVTAGLALGPLVRGDHRWEDRIHAALASKDVRTRRGALAALGGLGAEHVRRAAARLVDLVPMHGVHAWHHVCHLPDLDEISWSAVNGLVSGHVGQRYQAVGLLRTFLEGRSEERFVQLYQTLMEDEDPLVREEACRRVPRPARPDAVVSVGSTPPPARG